MSTFTKKSYGAIYVNCPSDIDRVKEIIKEMDNYEFDYLPHDLIKPFTSYPEVCYTHKFCDMDMDALTATCWSRGILIWVFDARTPYPPSAIEEQPSQPS